MAEQKVSIDGTVPVSGAVTLSGNTGANPLWVTETGPSGANFYTSIAPEVAGTVAANNLLSIFNPVGSGKLVTVYRFTAYPYAGGASTTTAGCSVFRTTAASGGVLRPAADVNKFDTTQPNSIVEVRTGNPTTTNGNVAILDVPPAITSAGAGVSAVVSIVPPTGATFVMRPGEGAVARVPAGDVDQIWTVSFTWAEM